MKQEKIYLKRCEILFNTAQLRFGHDGVEGGGVRPREGDVFLWEQMFSPSSALPRRMESDISDGGSRKELLEETGQT